MERRGDIEHAETLSRLRARLLPLAGISFIVVSALASGERTGLLGRALWITMFITLFGLVTTGGLLFMRRLGVFLEDESTRDHRRSAVFVGYCATVICAVGVYIVTAFEHLSAQQALHIVLATAVSAPLISFGAFERRALDGE